MATWLIILILIAAVFIISRLIHFKNLKHKIFAIIIIVLLGFFVLTFLALAKNSSITLKTASGIFSACKLYFSWLGHIFDNIRVLTGNAIRMEWFGNSTS